MQECQMEEEDEETDDDEDSYHYETTNGLFLILILKHSVWDEWWQAVCYKQNFFYLMQCY